MTEDPKNINRIMDLISEGYQLAGGSTKKIATALGYDDGDISRFCSENGSEKLARFLDHIGLSVHPCENKSIPKDEHAALTLFAMKGLER